MLRTTKTRMFKAREHHMLQIIWYFEFLSFYHIQKCLTLYTGHPETVTVL
jgi:hypothetical protein